MPGLPVSRLVRVAINLAPTAVQTRTFGVLMVAGDSSIISGLERYRSYTTLTGVAADFGTSAPEYYAAQLYFGQTPQPKTLMIGRWLRTATAAFLQGGTLSAAEQTIGTWTAVTSGGFQITVDGVAKSLTGLNFSGAANLAAVAAIIDSALTGATVAWNGSQFVATSGTTGATSTITAATAPVSGTDISAMLKWTTATKSALVQGYDAETPVQCASALALASNTWFGLMFSAATFPTDVQSLAVSDFIEALDVKRVYGVTITDTDALDSTVEDDLASLMRDAGYYQSFCQYSENAYAVASFFGRAFSVDFSRNNSTITLMYKQEPSVTPEELTETQANTLEDKRCNVFVEYENDTSIIQYGVMSGDAYFDEIHGIDWLQNAIQTACYNLLYTSLTKIPQTDAGVGQLVNAVQGACDQAVNNGLVAPGTWTGPTIGQITTGTYLKSGYYIFADSLATQSQGDREARLAPPITVCVKLAGAIQQIDVALDVNR